MFRNFFKNKQNIFEAFAVFLFLLILAGGFFSGSYGKNDFFAAVTPLCGEGEPCGGGGAGSGGILPPPPPPTPTTYTLSISKTGTGAGTITSSQPSKITCGNLCNALFNTGDQITLYANPSSGSVFAGWSGASCSGTSPCVITLNAAWSATANFISIIPPAPLPLLSGTANSYVVDNCANDGGTVNTIGDTNVCTSSALFPSCSFLSFNRWSLYSSRCTLRFLVACLRYEVNCVPNPSVLSAASFEKPTSIADTVGEITWKTVESAVRSILLKPSNPVFVDLKVNGSNDPLTVIEGTTVTVSWFSSGASNCNVYKKENNNLISSTLASGKTSGSQSEKITADNTKFSILCGGKTDSVAVTAVPPPPPPEPSADVKVKDPATGSFTDGTISVLQGSTITLRVDFSNVDACQMSHTGWTYGGSLAKDEEDVSVIDKTTIVTADTTYTLSCDGNYGAVSDSVTVNVIPKPTADINASPLTLPVGGGNVTLTWKSSNIGSCSVSSNPSVYSSTALSNPTPAPIAAITKGTTFSISCTGEGKTVSDSAFVSVASPPGGKDK